MTDETADCAAQASPIDRGARIDGNGAIHSLVQHADAQSLDAITHYAPFAKPFLQNDAQFDFQTATDSAGAAVESVAA